MHYYLIKRSDMHSHPYFPIHESKLIVHMNAFAKDSQIRESRLPKASKQFLGNKPRLYGDKGFSHT